MFVFRSIVDGNRHHDEKKLDDALRVLEIERGTWQAVCEKLAAPRTGGPGSERGDRSARAWNPRTEPAPPAAAGRRFVARQPAPPGVFVGSLNRLQ